VFLALAILRRRGSPDRPSGPADRTLVLAGGVLAVLVVVPTAVATIWAARGMEPGGDDTLQIAVTGHRFWWDVGYPLPGRTTVHQGVIRTANEIHVPVGRTVELRLRSEDVIHSFWVPRLAGKTDLIPGRENTLRIRADRPGVYRGQCAEFCGTSHAVMRLLVVAQEPEAFDAWLARQAAPADLDIDTGTRQAFANSCGPCHMVRGVFAQAAFAGVYGPDLTHVAGRRRIAAGVMPMTREGLGRWILDPQGVKPGSGMPDVGVDPDDLQDIVDFLMRLE
jgi:cytochrome c oxidase subunit 2